MQTSRRPVAWSAVALLALCAVVLFFSAMGVMIYGFQGVTALLDGKSGVATTFLINAAGSLARMLLLLPACYYALMRIMDRPAWHLRLAVVPSWLLVIIWLGSLGLGTLLLDADQLAPLLMPVLGILGAIIPIWLILRLAVRGLSLGSDLRRWGTFALGSTLGPFLTTVLEILLLFALLLAWIIYLVANPALLAGLQRLADRLQQASSDQAIFNLMLPYLTSPAVIFVVVLVMCLLIPLIEEAVKPIGVWVGLGKLSSPAQGFTLGALCGAGFALFENFSTAAMGGPDWPLVTAMRVGTAVMHIANSALMGWALVSAWSQRKYLRLGFVYLAVVLTHGLWNYLAISYGLARLPPLLQELSLEFDFNAPYALPGLALLALAMTSMLLIMNRHLQEPPYTGLAAEPGQASPPDSKV